MFYKYPHRKVCKVIAKTEIKQFPFDLLQNKLNLSEKTNSCCCKQGVCWTWFTQTLPLFLLNQRKFSHPYYMNN